MKTSKTSQHIWRFVRIFAVTFGAALLTSAQATGIHGALTSKAVLSAVLGAAVAVVETLYRAISPAGQSRILTAVAAVQQAYKSLQSSLPTPVQKAVAYAAAEVETAEAAVPAAYAPDANPQPTGAPPGV